MKKYAKTYKDIKKEKQSELIPAIAFFVMITIALLVGGWLDYGVI